MMSTWQSCLAANTYLALVLVSVDELGTVTCNFVLTRSYILLGSVQGNLDVLDVRTEDRVKVSW